MQFNKYKIYKNLFLQENVKNKKLCKSHSCHKSACVKGTRHMHRVDLVSEILYVIQREYIKTCCRGADKCVSDSSTIPKDLVFLMLVLEKYSQLQQHHLQ